MSFIIAILLWIYSWESRPEVKPWPPKPNKYKAMMDEAYKQMKDGR